MLAIDVRGLVKTYSGFEAVKGITFDVKEGAFFALLGPNGAGKSTTISVICSLLDYDSGTVEIFGKAPSDPTARIDIGVVFQDHMLDGRLTVRENITLRGAMYGLKGAELDSAVKDALTTTNALEYADRMYGQLSGGQKRRVDIARALVHKPKILLLDEPTSGLDPQNRKAIWNTVFDLNRSSGVTVFLTTHYMEEASEADDIVIVDKGEIVAHGTPQKLKERYCTDRLAIVPKDAAAVRRALGDRGVAYVERKGTITVTLSSTLDSISLINLLKDSMESFEVRTGTLDDAFIEITGCDAE